MFKKTRNRIMLLNMLIVSAVVLVAFAAIFLTTYTHLEAENQKRININLSRPFLIGERRTISSEEMAIAMGMLPAANTNRTLNDTIVIYHSGHHRQISNEDLLIEEFRYQQNHILPGEGISISVLLNPDNNVIGTTWFVSLSSEARQRVLQIASEEVHGARTVSIEGRIWRVISTPASAMLNMGSGSRFWHEGVSYDTFDGYTHVRFFDVTESHQMLQTLALTLIGAALAVLTVFFFISRFFAKQAVKPMEEAWEKQRQFITDASHELKTPLSVINANCGVLYSNQDEPFNEQIRWVDSISRATDRMTGLVGSLLSLASMDDSQYELHSSTFNLGEEMTAAVSEMEVIAVDKGITLNKEIEPELMIESDKEQVRKILSTLMENAVKYTPFNGVITASVSKEKRRIICAVRNSGPGIPQNELPDVFDRFYRGDPARSSDNSGYGLGLAIAKTIAGKLGAKLSVESREEEYTEFKLSFEN